jgi:hypothetical protein
MTPFGTVSDQSLPSGSGIQVNLRVSEDWKQEFGNLQILTKALATKIMVSWLATWCGDICNCCDKIYCKLTAYGEGIYFSLAQQCNSGLGRTIFGVFISQKITDMRALGLFWKSDQLVAKAVTYISHNKQKRRKSYLQQDWNPQTEKSSGRRSTP